jgi:hypothetical protein
MGGSWEDIMGTRGKHLASPLQRRVSRHWALPLALAISLLTAGVAWADNVQNDVVAGGNDTFILGGSTTVNYRITANSGDGQPGCNAADASPATVTVNTPAAVAASPASLTFTSCGTNQPVVFTASAAGDYEITVSVTDSGAGTYNTSPAKFTLHVLPPPDTTPPVITPNLTGTLGANGWYTSDVAVSWTVTDPDSTVTSTTGCGPASVTSDTSGTTFTCSATSAGGTASASVTVKRDTTAPTISGAATPAPNGAGWNNTDVAVAFSCADATSGVASCGPNQTLTADGAGQSATGTATDDAGNSASATVSGINIDKTAPTVECSQPDASVWYGSNVVVSCISSDATSGLADTADSTFTLSTTVAAGDETATATTGSRTVADLAGNSTTVGPFTFKVDRKAPEVTCGSPDGLWHAADVSIFCTAGDGGSGLTGPAAFTLSTSVAAGVETDSAYTGSVSVTDGVGNATTAGPIGPNKVDKQAPAITATRTPANVNGWNSGDVTVEFTCSDGGSGLASCAAPVTVSSEGANQAVTGTATDNVGNTASTEVSGINIDKTAPTISGAVGPTVLAVNTAASVNFTATDSLSGVDAEQYSVDGGPWTSASTPLIITTADVVNLCVRATDKAGNVSDPECVLLAVYDPSAGFVTGGGWIMSPAGAYVDAPAMTGKATFGFVSKYKKGATVPEGNTEFQFHAAGFNFKSTSYEWLVVSGSRAQYKGVGTVNGVPGYGFMLTAIDGSPDKFRIKVWSVATGDTVYDNQMGGADTADPTTALAGGSVVIHSTKK